MITDKDNLTAPRAPSAGEVSKLAKASRISGILGFICLVAAAPPFILILGAIAIICGHIARRRIRRDPASTGGSGVALAGLILGYMSVGLALLDRYDCERTLNRAKTVTTLGTATALESSVNSFFIEYGKLPDIENRVTTNSPQGLELLNILLGTKGNSANPQNPRQIKFLAVREGRNHKNGLLYSQSGDSVEGLFDPWGSPYTVILDTDYDKLLRFKIASKDVELKGRRVAVFSPGADQKEGTHDDIRTWCGRGR